MTHGDIIAWNFGVGDQFIPGDALAEVQNMIYASRALFFTVTLKLSSTEDARNN